MERPLELHGARSTAPRANVRAIRALKVQHSDLAHIREHTGLPVAMQITAPKPGRLPLEPSALRDGLPVELRERLAMLELEDAAADGPTAAAIWEVLWRGGYAVETVMERHGRRYLVLRSPGPGKQSTLTAAERAVCALALREDALKIIAATLGIAVSTVSTHLTRGLRKLGLSHRAELARLAGP